MLSKPYRIPELVEAAHRIGGAKNYHAETEGSIPTFEYFDSPIEIDGKQYNAHIRVKNTNMGDKYYGHTVSEVESIEIEAPTRTSVPDSRAVQLENTGASDGSNNASDITVPQAAPVVKPDAAISPGGVTPGGTGAAQAPGTSSQDGTTTATTSNPDTDQTAEVSPEPIPPRQQEPENGK